LHRLVAKSDFFVFVQFVVVPAQVFVGSTAYAFSVKDAGSRRFCALQGAKRESARKKKTPVVLAGGGEMHRVNAKSLRCLAALLALLIAPLATAVRADAACTPASPVNNAIVTCAGATTNQNGADAYGTNADNGNTINVQAGASVTATAGDGIVFNTAIINNAGTILASSPTGGIAIIGNAATVNNTGTIAGTGGSQAFGILLISRSSVTNSGTISGNEFGIELASGGTVTNSGTITGGSNSALNLFGATDINNLGIIRGAGSAISGSAVNLINGVSGRIEATGAGGVAIDAQAVNLSSNGGTITGTIGIRAGNASTVTNSGTIEGTGGTAIKFGPRADTLTLLPGSKIIGAVDMGGGADTVNLVSSAAITTRVSSLIKVLTASLPSLINFTGTINTITNVANATGLPTAQSGNNIATLDPTAFGQADRVLMNFTGGISSLVRSRLGGTATNGAAVQVVSFAPTGAVGHPADAFAGMGYAAERTLAHAFTYTDAPYNVWTSGFGGTSTQRGNDTMLRSIASAGAGLIGVDRQVRPDLLIGAFAGGGAGRLSVELNSQSIDTDYVTAGVYGRFDWTSHFLDVTLQSGATANKSKRLVLTDSGPGGSETATAGYDSWYVSPEVAYGRRYQFANGYTLTPVGRIRYLAGMFDGYNESGSAQNLMVGRRTLHDLEERAEVELSKITGVAAGSFRTSVYGGLIALQRLGNPTINTVLIGQDLSFTTPGKDSTAGVVGGAGFDFRATERMSLFGAFEATLMSDRSRTAAAKAGLKFAF
jgi:hypothetical protein